VDDVESNVALLEQMLGDAGYVSVASTSNPFEVADLHRKNGYSLILLDLQMPGRDGFQVMEDLKPVETGGYLPVLVITAQPDHKLLALKAGARDFVSKPFDFAEVLTRVHNLLEVRLLHLETKTLYDQIVKEQKVSEQLLAIFRAGPAAMSVKTVAGARIIDANEEFCRFYGYSREEIVGRSIVGHDLPGNPDYRAGFMRRLLKEGAARGFEAQQCRRSGEVRDILASMELVNLPGVPELVYIAMFTDVTDQKRAQRNLLESEERFRQLAENVQEVFWLSDAGKTKILYVSPAYEGIWGRSCESLYAAPQTWMLAIHPEDRDRVAHAATTKQVIGEYDEEYRITRPDGSVRWIHDRAFPIGSDEKEASGGTRRIAGIASDITERKGIERQLLRAQRLESISALAGGVAHDLNNALAPILMGVQLLRNDNPDQHGLIDTIETCAMRGAEMVRQLVTFAEGVPGARLAIQPRYLVREMEAIVRSTFPKNVHLRVVCEADCKTVLGDATQLQQVLLNLCVNARDAMPQGGMLTLEARNLEIDATNERAYPEAKRGIYVLWRVADSGLGIPAGIIDRVFEPFFSTKGPAVGAGLGLSTVLGVVKSHGGFVNVRSELGKGSTFDVYLPSFEAETIALNPSISKPQFRGDGETILVVDDENVVREVTRSVLAGLNFRVLTAADGTEALIKVAENRLDIRVVITDLQMPHMDGLGFARVVKRMLPDASIIVASGRLAESDRKQFRLLGINLVLDKPFSQEDLVNMLRSVFQK
jgi:PAS domain S-box-containing protein